jgi:hypothetical protein
MTSNERFVKERKKGRLPDRVIVIINIFLFVVVGRSWHTTGAGQWKERDAAAKRTCQVNCIL